MATFTDQEIADIADVLGVDTLRLSDQLTYFADRILAESKTKALEKVETFNDLNGEPTVEIHPMATNKGVKISPDSYKADLRRSIANLLFVSDLISGGTRLQRS